MREAARIVPGRWALQELREHTGPSLIDVDDPLDHLTDLMANENDRQIKHQLLVHEVHQVQQQDVDEDEGRAMWGPRGPGSGAAFKTEPTGSLKTTGAYGPGRYLLPICPSGCTSFPPPPLLALASFFFFVPFSPSPSDA